MSLIVLRACCDFTDDPELDVARGGRGIPGEPPTTALATAALFRCMAPRIPRRWALPTWVYDTLLLSPTFGLAPEMALSLWTDDEHLNDLPTRCPLLRRLDATSCFGLRSAANLRGIASMPLLSELILDQTDVSDAWLSTNLQRLRLRRLSCVKCAELTSAAFTALFDSTRPAMCPSLTHLRLAGTRGINDAALAIVGAHCASLTFVDVSWCGLVTDSGLASLSRCRLLRVLVAEALPQVRGTFLAPPKAQEQALSVAFESLEVLNVMQCERVGDALLHALAACPQKRHTVEALLLSSLFTETTSAGLCACLRNLASLRTLDVGQLFVDDEVMMAISDLPHLQRLVAVPTSTYLLRPEQQLTRAGIEAALLRPAVPCRAALRRLDMSDTDLCPETAAKIIVHFPRLCELAVDAELRAHPTVKAAAAATAGRVRLVESLSGVVGTFHV